MFFSLNGFWSITRWKDSLEMSMTWLLPWKTMSLMTRPTATLCWTPCPLNPLANSRLEMTGCGPKMAFWSSVLYSYSPAQLFCTCQDGEHYLELKYKVYLYGFKCWNTMCNGWPNFLFEKCMVNFKVKTIWIFVLDNLVFHKFHWFNLTNLCRWFSC